MKKIKYNTYKAVSILVMLFLAACTEFDPTPGITTETDRTLETVTVEAVAEDPAEEIDITVRAGFDDGMSVRVTKAAVIKVNGATVQSPWKPVPAATYNLEAQYEGKTATAAISVASVSLTLSASEIETAQEVSFTTVVTFDNGMTLRANNTATYTANGQPIQNPWIPDQGGDFEIVATFGGKTATTNINVEWGLIPVQFDFTAGLTAAFASNASGLRNGSLEVDAVTGDRVISIPDLYGLAEGKTGGDATTPHTFVDHTAVIRIHADNSVTFDRITVLSAYRIGDTNYLDWDVLQNGAGSYNPATKTLTIPVQGNLNYYGTYQWGTGTDILVLTSGSIPE